MKSGSVTLVAHDPLTSDLVWATTVSDKRQLLKVTDGKLYAFWKGRYTSHLFVVDRARAETEVGIESASGPIDPGIMKMFEWWADEAARQGFSTVRVSKAAPEQSAAKLLKTVAGGRKIQAVGQFALTDDRPGWHWRGKILKLSQLWRQWDRILADWEHAGSPEYVQGWVRGEGSAV